MTLDTNTHAVRGRLTSKRRLKRHFRSESAYRDLKSKNDTQRYTKTQRYSNTTQRYSNTQICSNTQRYSNTQICSNTETLKTRKTTNSLVHSYMRNPEALYSIKPLRCLISREWPFYLTISLLFICLFVLINCCDYHASLLVFVCSIIIAACIRHVVMKFDDFFVCLANECCLFEKAEELNTSLCEAYLINRSELRSRYAKYILKQEEEST